MRASLRAAAATCCVGLIALVAGCGSTPAGAAAATAPTLDAATQAYLSVLRAYYVPLVTANSPARICLRDTGRAEHDVQAQQMASCRPLYSAELAAAQTFAFQIAAATPPVAWQAEDSTLKQAAPSLVTLLTAQLADIDAHNVAQFIVSEDTATPVLYRFLSPIQQINVDIHAGPPPLPQALPTLYYQFT